MTMIWTVIGSFLAGGVLGVLLMALLVANRHDD